MFISPTDARLTMFPRFLSVLILAGTAACASPTPRAPVVAEVLAPSNVHQLPPPPPRVPVRAAATKPVLPIDAGATDDEPVLDDAAGEAADYARMRPGPCHITFALWAHRMLWSADKARWVAREDPAIGIEVLFTGFDHTGCHEVPLWKPIDRGRQSWPMTFGFYGQLLGAIETNYEEVVAGTTNGQLKCWFPGGPTLTERTSKQTLTGPCALPQAWRKRGLARENLCLDRRVYAVFLALWTHAGGDPESEEAFVALVRWASHKAWEKDLSPQDHAAFAAQCEIPKFKD